MSHALVVGCSSYEDPDIAPLRFAHQDAARIADVLRDVCGVAPDEIVVLHDGLPPAQRPTRTNVLRQLTRLSRAATDGILYFFFSGHGFQAVDHRQFLLPIDCVRDAIEETALPFDTVVRYLAGASAPHVVLFLDACRNVVSGGKSVEADLPHVDVDALCPPGVVSFCSCLPGTVSYEAESLGSGLFTEALCQALSTEGRRRTIYEVDRFLVERVPVLAREHGKPTQVAHSRVEPLSVQHLEIVSERTRLAWRSSTPLGTERRRRLVERVVAADSVVDPLVAIDFGTSYSIVSWCRPDGEVILLPGPDRRPMVPSVVHFLPDLDYLVGQDAVEADPYRPAATIRYAKRRLGTDADYEVDGRSVGPELAASLILRSLRRNAEEALGTPVRQCLASYPAHFTLRQIEALERAFELADLQVKRFIGEPNVAALLTLNASTSDEDWFLVVDLGGGTFDVALVDAGEGVAEVVSSNGSNSVGGLDYDDALVAYAERYLRTSQGWGEDVIAPLRERLRREAERAKRDLGRRPATTILLQDVDDGARGLVDVSIEIDRACFRAVTRSLDEQVRATMESCFTRLPFGDRLADWRRQGGQVLLAGQGGKIFTVREQIESLLPGAPILTQFQETAVVHGLGMQAGVLTGVQQEVLLLNALQFGVGVLVSRAARGSPSAPAELVGLVELLDVSTTIPTRRTEFLELDGPPGTPYVLEIVELPLAADRIFGGVPCVASGHRKSIEVDVDADANVRIIVADPGTNGKDEYQVNGHGTRSYFASEAVRPLPPPTRDRHGVVDGAVPSIGTPPPHPGS